MSQSDRLTCFEQPQPLCPWCSSNPERSVAVLCLQGLQVKQRSVDRVDRPSRVTHHEPTYLAHLSVHLICLAQTLSISLGDRSLVPTSSNHLLHGPQRTGSSMKATIQRNASWVGKKHEDNVQNVQNPSTGTPPKPLQKHKGRKSSENMCKHLHDHRTTTNDSSTTSKKRQEDMSQKK